MRAFAKKSKKSKKNAEGVTTDDEANAVEEEVEAAAPEEPVQEVAKEIIQDAPTESFDMSGASLKQPPQQVDAGLFEAFSVGDIKQIQSAPDHKPPTQEDTIEGRYAAVLFTSASQQEALYTIYEDIGYIKSLYENSETFSMFTRNAGVGTKEI